MEPNDTSKPEPALNNEGATEPEPHVTPDLESPSNSSVGHDQVLVHNPGTVIQPASLKKDEPSSSNSNVAASEPVVSPSSDVTPAPPTTPNVPQMSADITRGNTVSHSDSNVFSSQASMPADSSSKPKRKIWRKVALICVVLILVLSGGAAAYYNFYYTQQPSYILDSALKNTFSQTQFTANTTINVNQNGGSGVAFKATSLSSVNLNSRQIDENLTLTISGVSLPVEARLVDQNIYVKFGNLTPIVSILNAFSPQAASIIQPIAGKLSNQWIAIDSTLLDSDPTLKCLINANWTLSTSNTDFISSSYLKQPFLSVKSTSSDSVNGTPSEKMVLSANNYQAVQYFKGLLSHRVFGQCPGISSNPSISLPSKKTTTPLTVWVDKGDNRIDQIGYITSSGGDQVSLISSVSYSPVNVTVPSNPEPVAQLLVQLEQVEKNNPVLQSYLGSSTSGL